MKYICLVCVVVYLWIIVFLERNMMISFIEFIKKRNY
jgi:hypothetical protein